LISKLFRGYTAVLLVSLAFCTLSGSPKTDEIDGKAGEPNGAVQSLERRRSEDSVSMKLYVGNLPYSTTEEDLRKLFSQYGNVDSVAVITDRDTGRSKGFGFVEFPDENEARNAISALSGQEFGGRALTVNEARPKTGGGRGGYGGGGRERY
jgi:RNA recognition motif-containing protein